MNNNNWIYDIIKYDMKDQSIEKKAQREEIIVEKVSDKIKDAIELFAENKAEIKRIKEKLIEPLEEEIEPLKEEFKDIHDKLTKNGEMHTTIIAGLENIVKVIDIKREKFTKNAEKMLEEMMEHVHRYGNITKDWLEEYIKTHKKIEVTQRVEVKKKSNLEKNALIKEFIEKTKETLISLKDKLLSLLGLGEKTEKEVSEAQIALATL